MAAGTGATAHESGGHEVPAFDSAEAGHEPVGRQPPASAASGHQPTAAAAGSGAQALHGTLSAHGPHDLHGHDDDHDDHGAADDAWVVLPLAVGLLIGLVLAIVFGFATSAASIV